MEERKLVLGNIVGTSSSQVAIFQQRSRQPSVQKSWGTFGCYLASSNDGSRASWLVPSGIDFPARASALMDVHARNFENDAYEVLFTHSRPRLARTRGTAPVHESPGHFRSGLGNLESGWLNSKMANFGRFWLYFLVLAFFGQVILIFFT